MHEKYTPGKHIMSDRFNRFKEPKQIPYYLSQNDWHNCSRCDSAGTITIRSWCWNTINSENVQRSGENKITKFVRLRHKRPRNMYLKLLCVISPKMSRWCYNSITPFGRSLGEYSLVVVRAPCCIVLYLSLLILKIMNNQDGNSSS